MKSNNQQENIYSLKGMDKVFRFTLKQTFKNKSYRLSFIIFVLVMITQRPINYFASRSGQSAANTMTQVTAESADHVIVINETDVPLTLEDLTGPLQEQEKNQQSEKAPLSTRISLSAQNAEQTVAGLENKDCAVIITRSETGYFIKGVITKTSAVDISDADDLTSYVSDRFSDARLTANGISDDNLLVLQKGVSVGGVDSELDFIAEQSDTVSSQNYMFYALTFSIIIFLICSMSTSYVIASVTEEKTSKLVESLLVSVRPAALLLGKVLGMMSYVMLILITGVVGAKLVDIVMFDILKLEQLEHTGGFDINILIKFGPGGLVLFIVCIILGYLTFSILSGMLGSACSKTEDIQAATGTVMTLSMFSYFGAIAAGGMDSELINLVFSLLPPFSFFIMPVAYLAGRISLIFMVLSFVIQIATLVVLIWIMAKAYRNLLLADNSQPKLKTVFRAMRS